MKSQTKLSAKDDAGHLGRDVARAHVLGVCAFSPDDLCLRSALASVLGLAFRVFGGSGGLVKIACKYLTYDSCSYSLSPLAFSASYQS